MKERLAIFDVDGTLFDGNLGIEFVKALIQKGLFKQELGATMFGWYGKYKSGEVEKAVAVDEIYKLYAQGMKGLSQEKAREVAKETWKTVSPKVFEFVPEVVEGLVDKGYMVLLLSGSPEEMVENLARTVCVDDNNIVAGRLEIVDGVYTGNIISYLGSPEQKVAALYEMVGRQNLDVDWPGSIAMGDNERDLEILTRVGHPIAFNPSDRLADIATRNGWTVASKDTAAAIIRGL